MHLVCRIFIHKAVHSGVAAAPLHSSIWRFAAELGLAVKKASLVDREGARLPTSKPVAVLQCTVAQVDLAQLTAADKQPL